MLTFDIKHGVIRIYRGQKLITQGAVYDRPHAEKIMNRFNKWASQGWPPKDE